MKFAIVAAAFGLLVGGALTVSAQPKGHDHGAHGHTHGAPAAQAGPTLKDVMVDLGKNMGEINDALWREDLAAVGQAAQSIVSHPHIAPEGKKRLKSILKAEMMAFGKADKVVHQAAKDLDRFAIDLIPQVWS
jgi:hypothetical protein